MEVKALIHQVYGKMQCSDLNCKPHCLVFPGSPEPRQKPQHLELENSVPKKPPAADLPALQMRHRGVCSAQEQNFTQLSGPLQLMNIVDSNTAGKPGLNHNTQWLE